MIAYLIMGVLALAGILMLANGFVRARPADIIAVGRVVVPGVLLLVLLYLTISGRLAVALAAAMALVPLLLRGKAILNRLRSMAGPSTGHSSTLRTALFTLHLDHDTGRVDGEVTDGPFAGRHLSDLDLGELLELREACVAGDPQALAAIEAYIDRVHGPDWRHAQDHGGNAAGASTSGAMTRAEALAILGLSDGATPEQIRQAHRRLMKQMHPDHGGSDYLASKVNTAKDVLLPN